MAQYDNTNLDQIEELIDRCIENLRKVFAPLGVGPYNSHREKIDFTDPVRIKRALSIYGTFNLHDDTTALNDYQLHKRFNKEILSNLSCFTGQQERYYHAIVRKFLTKIRSVSEEIKDYDKVCLTTNDLLDGIGGENAPALYGNLSTDIYEIQLATHALDHILQPYLIPYFEEDYKVAIEGKGSVDFFVPNRPGNTLSSSDSNLNSTVQETESELIESRFGWAGSKTDLAELIWALSKSKCIVDNNTKKPITQDELTSQFEVLFGFSIGTKGLMQGRKDSYKATDDGLTFTAHLSKLVDNHILNK